MLLHRQVELGLSYTTQPFFLIFCHTFEKPQIFQRDPYAETAKFCNHISCYYNVLFSVDVADLKDFDDEHTDKEEDLSVIVPVDHIFSWDDIDRDGKCKCCVIYFLGNLVFGGVVKTSRKTPMK